MRHGTFLTVLSTLALASLAQEKGGLYAGGKTLETQPEVEPNCIRYVENMEIKYYCRQQNISMTIAHDYSHVNIRCTGQLLKCSHLPHAEFKNKSLQRLKIESCAVSSSLECVLSSLNITGGVRTLQFASVSTPITAETIRGLDTMHIETLIINSKTPNRAYETVPMEVIKQLPSLTKLQMDQEGVNALTPFAFNQTGVSAKLATINICQNNITTLPADAFYGLRNLTHLCLPQNNIENINGNAFRGMDSLKTVVLSENSIIDLPVGLFHDAPLLQKIEIRRNTQPLRLKAGVFSGLDHLSELDTGSTELQLGPMSLSNLPSLQNLIMPGCGITDLPADLLINTSAVVNLLLNNNTLMNLPDTVFSGLVKLKVLDLRFNQLKTVTVANFKFLRDLEVLRLDGNLLIDLPDKVFSLLPLLFTLSISHNDLSQINNTTFEGATAKTLNLSHNNLTWDCISFISVDGQQKKLKTYTKSHLYTMENLEHLYLSHNHITSVCDDWLHDMIRLKDLDLSYNNLTNLEERDINFSSRSIEVNLRNNSITSFIPPTTSIIKPPSLQLGGNPFHCDCELYIFLKQLKSDDSPYDVEDARCHLPKPLEGVNLTSVANGKRTSSMSLVNITCPLLNTPTDCQCLVRPEMNRTECVCLDLKNKILPDPANNGTMLLKVTQSAENLEKIPRFVRQLNLSNLKLEIVPDFPESVTHVDLRRNKLSRVPLEILQRNITLELGGNPLAYNCWNTKDIENIKDNQLKINDYESLRFANGENLNENAELCSKVIAATYGISITVIGIILCIIVILFYKYSVEIKVYLFNLGCTIIVKEETIDANKKYDIFLSFVHEDEEFVLDSLFPELDKNYKVCIHTRDWIVGDSIVEQIYRSVAESRRTLIVLSNSFLESNSWAIEEFRAAQTQTDVDKIPRAVIILYGDVNCDAAPDTIKSHLQINTYIKWSDSLFWERLRYALPKNKIKAEDIRRRELTAKAVKNRSKDIAIVMDKHNQTINASNNDNHLKHEFNKVERHDRLYPLSREMVPLMPK